MRFRFLFFVPVLGVAACSSSGDVTGGDASTDAVADSHASDASSDTANDTSTSDAPSDGGGACNAIANVASMIALDYIASDPPTPHGGTIADGTYIMTAAGFYTGTGGVAGSSGVTSQVTIQISGSTIQVASKANPPNDHITTTVMTNGVNLTRTDTCPDSTTQSGTYTATPTTLVVILPAGTFPDGGTKTLVESFTKQ
jgi:hypothetical protein